MEKYRLLVIEDDQEIASLVCKIAQEAGFETRASADIMNIPDLHDTFKPQLIVLDIIMPDMDGFEVLSFLHKRGSPAHVVILSGQPGYRPMAERMGEGLELPIVATVAKPFRLAAFRQLLEDAKPTLPQNSAFSSAAA